MDTREGLEERDEMESASSKPPLAAVISVRSTKYQVVSTVAESLGMVATADASADFDLQWSDSTGSLERFMELKPYQRINHFPGMGGIARKDSLARNIQKMRKQFPEDFDFIPTTWVLPAQYSMLRAILSDQQRRKKSKTYIVKPPNSSQGQGIHLIQRPEQLPKAEVSVVQEYLGKPLLIDGFKFDLRIYVLVTSCDPLKIFLYKDGLVRLSTKAYVPPSVDNLHESFMHLTNYSINKHSETFTKEDGIDRGSKRTLQWFNQWLVHNGHNCVEVWENIADVVIKTLLSVHPQVVHSYQACRPGVTAGNDTCSFFEILGFDIILDRNLKAWLLEVNRSPSFNTDSQLDLDIKSGLIHDALRLINLRPPMRSKHLLQEKAASRMRLLSASSTPKTAKSAPSSTPFDHTPSGGCTNNTKMYEIQKQMAAVKQRLDQLAWQREQNDYEAAHMGDYRRIYPTADPLKAEHFSLLLREAARVSLAGASGLRKKSGSQALLRMKESQLQELLQQFQAKSSIPQDGLSTKVAALQGTSDADMDYSLVSVNREREAERTQRVMVALAATAPQMDGHLLQDVSVGARAVRDGWERHQANVATFWLLPGGKERRREIVQGVFQQVRGAVMRYWGQQDLNTVRLYRIFVKLKSFLLGHGGQGLWSSFSVERLSWEQTFKSRLDVMSISEFECCRHAVRLCQDAVLAHYYHNSPRQLGSKSNSSPSVKEPAPKGKSSNFLPSYRTVPPAGSGLLPRIPLC